MCPNLLLDDLEEPFLPSSQAIGKAMPFQIDFKQEFRFFKLNRSRIKHYFNAPVVDKEGNVLSCLDCQRALLPSCKDQNSSFTN